jgi:hypothetical protein
MWDETRRADSEACKKFEEDLNNLLVEAATTPEEHLAALRKLQKLFEDNERAAWQVGVDTSASYRRDNQAQQIFDKAEEAGISPFAVNYYNWLPSSWDQC